MPQEIENSKQHNTDNKKILYKMATQEIQDRITAFMVDELEIAPEKITAEALMKEDLGIDSLEVVDVVVLVEKEFGVKIKAEDFKVLKTIEQLTDFISGKIA